MPIFYGKLTDGSNIQEFEGMHMSSCGNFWGNTPFTPESEQMMKKSISKAGNKQKWKDLMNGKSKTKCTT